MKKKFIYNLIHRSGCTDKKSNLNRRDLIKLGLLSGGGYVLPSFFPKSLYAAVDKNVHIPFLVFDLAGGAGLPANFLVGKKGGPEDLCSTYKQHAWDPRESDALDHTFGLPMSKKHSKILIGLKEVLPESLSSAEINKNFKMTSICNFSVDDTRDNKLSALSLISKAGLAGEHLKNGLGQVPSKSGGNSRSFLDDPVYKPKFIKNRNDVLNLIGLGENFSNLSKDTKNKIFEQLREFGQIEGELKSAYSDLSLFGHSLNEADPLEDQHVMDLYQLEENQAEGDNYVQAAIAYNVISGNTGPGVITIEGCDYHDFLEPVVDNKDLAIGRAVGRAVNLAHHLNKPLFFQIITDGGVYYTDKNFEETNNKWAGDENMHSLTIMGYYNPEKEIEIIRPQLGYYTNEGELQTDTNVGYAPEDMVRAVAVNYLNIHSKLGQFQELTGIRGMNNKDLDELISLG